MRTWHRVVSLVAALLVLELRAEVDLQSLDRSVRPQDDFYRFANGGWLKSHPVPEDQAAWGPDAILKQGIQERMRAILERAAARRNPGPVERLVGDFYASGMDEAAINAAGVEPLRDDLDRIAAIANTADVAAVLARLHRWGIPAGFVAGVEPEPRSSRTYVGYLAQGGVGVPSRDFYLSDAAISQSLRKLYEAHVAKILELAGDSSEGAQQSAVAVLRLEKALAQGFRAPAEMMDPTANTHLLTLADLQELTPLFKWSVFFQQIGVAAPGTIDVGQPEYLKTFASVLVVAPLGDWKAYLRWQVLHAAAPSLSDAFVREDFKFYHQTLLGTPQLADRWRRVVVALEVIGQALGQVYVADAFTPGAKTRATALVREVRAAFRARVARLDWMDNTTRAEALRKIDALVIKVGYPDKWPEYEGLSINRGPFAGNIRRAIEFNVARELAKIGRPVDRAEWTMTPQTVDANYNAPLNAITIAAGYLQPPYFDARPEAEPLGNYAGIGATVGHEITHGFDTQGCQFDATGALHNWWQAGSGGRFAERAAEIVRQFDGYVVLDGLHVSGQLTEAEDIADLGGVLAAYDAYRAASVRQPPVASIGGFTPDQRFFLAYATAWRQNTRPEYLRAIVTTDAHAPNPFRVNGPLSNMPAFARAFDVPEGAPMRRPVAKRVAIW